MEGRDKRVKNGEGMAHTSCENRAITSIISCVNCMCVCEKERICTHKDKIKSRSPSWALSSPTGFIWIITTVLSLILRVFVSSL